MKISDVIKLVEEITQTDDKTIASDLFYYPNINIWTNKNNTKPIKQFANLSWLDWHKEKYTKESKTHSSRINLLIRKSLNGYVVFTPINNSVIKIQHKLLEPDFIQNNTKARKLLPNNTLPVQKTGSTDNHHYHVFPFVSGSRVSNWKNWNKTLDKTISPIYQNFLERNELTKTKASNYFDQLLKQAESHLITNQYLQNEFKKTLNHLKTVTSQLLNNSENNISIHTGFVHGDLVPNNVIKTKNNKIILLDWANGGNHSVYYDLLLQDFYNSSAKTWENFNKINFITNTDKKIFHGWSKKFCDMIAKKTSGTDISNDQVKLSLIAALYEISIKNFLRHQSQTEQKDGITMLRIVNQICSNIIDNI
jgi:hypothetical protein